jgi:SNF2 family DNA or RNA helicase
VFLLSLRAGGTGLNLTAATYVVHLDPWWNPAVEDQATDRAHRIGQERPVTVIRLVARGTIEEQVLSLHEEKRQLAASILDGSDVAARLDSDDLLDLIRRSGTPADENDAADADDTVADTSATADPRG